MFRKIGENNSGFSIIELIIVIGIVSMVSLFIFVVQKDIFSLNSFLQQAFSNQRDAERVMQNVIKELRAAGQSNIGSYAIEIANNNSLAFYANTDKDSLKERVHYFLQDAALKKSVIKPAGNPLTYSTTTASETLTTVLNNVVASSTAPIFSYYDSFYAGTSTAMAQPVNIVLVRLIKINFTVSSYNAPQSGVTVSSSIAIRNLKDNL